MPPAANRLDSPSAHTLSSALLLAQGFAALSALNHSDMNVVSTSAQARGTHSPKRPLSYAERRDAARGQHLEYLGALLGAAKLAAGGRRGDGSCWPCPERTSVAPTTHARTNAGVMLPAVLSVTVSLPAPLLSTTGSLPLHTEGRNLHQHAQCAL